MDIRANEGVVIPQFPARHWQIADKKGPMVYRLHKNDIIIGLVRPERRNIGLLLHSGDDIVGSPDGIAVVRVKKKYSKQYPQEWLFAELRSERSRLQLWTESGGTSYGKLTSTHIESLLIAVPEEEEVKAIRTRVQSWANSFSDAFEHWNTIGLPEDRRPIINSAIIGLDSDESGDS
jgi:type I restriction enzyme M protein